MKLLVMPSQPTEGLPTTILESLACGTPVYATAVGGVPDIVKSGETGFIIKSQKVNKMKNNIKEMLNDESLPLISSQGRKIIQEEYSFEAAVERYKDIISTINENKFID
jgi:glycosyltransferase involved in cell wall biosynthesis